MTELENKFKSFLDSNLTCDKVNEEMNKLSKYELNMELNEDKFTHAFFGFCEQHFYKEIESLLSENQTGIEICAPNVFLLSHKIMNNKDKYKDNSLCILFLINYIFFDIWKEKDLSRP